MRAASARNHENAIECMIRDASQPYTHIRTAQGTPHHRAIPFVALQRMLVSIPLALGALATAEYRSDASAQRPTACAWPSLYRSTELLSHDNRQPPCRACRPRHHLEHNRTCKPPCASVECTVCTRHAACSWPASTTSAMNSSRVLTHRLAICSRSELLHRGNTLLTRRKLTVDRHLPELIFLALQSAEPSIASNQPLPSAETSYLLPLIIVLRRMHFPGSTSGRSSNG